MDNSAARNYNSLNVKILLENLLNQFVFTANNIRLFSIFAFGKLAQSPCLSNLSRPIDN